MDKSNMDNIKWQMLVARVKQKDIAALLGVSPQAINQVISGKRPSSRIRQAIATAVGRPISELWPDNSQSTKESP